MKHKPLGFHVNTCQFTKWHLLAFRTRVSAPIVNYLEDKYYVKDVHRQLSRTADMQNKYVNETY